VGNEGDIMPEETYTETTKVYMVSVKFMKKDWEWKSLLYITVS
jgi:hypothetical protein